MRHSFVSSVRSRCVQVLIGVALGFGAIEAQTPASLPTSASFGQVAINGAPGANSVTYTFTGYANPQFALAYNSDFTLKNSSCSGTGTITCTVNISFTPTSPGIRKNAVIVKDASGNFLGATLLYGTGLAPQATIYPKVIATIAGKPGIAGIGSFTNGDGGPAGQALLFNPQGLAVDNAGNLYIADSLDSVVRKVSTTGVITTVAGRMAVPGFSGDGGPATNASLNGPVAVALDGAGNLYIVDQGNNRIRKVNAITGQISTVAGGGSGLGSANGIGDGGRATDAVLSGPSDIAVDGAGNLYISGSYSGSIRKVTAATGMITSVVAGLNNPRSVDVDAAGNLYIAVAGMVEKVDTTGKVTMLAQLVNPMCVRVDAAGNVYITDQGKNQVLLFNPQTQTVSVLAGNGGSGYSGDGTLATATTLNAPLGLAFDAVGNIYLSDSGSQIVRRIASAAGLSFPDTIVGEISQPQSLTVLNTGNQPLTLSSVSVNANFQKQTITGATCASGSVLQTAGTCIVPVSFAPLTSGAIYGLAVLTSNSLNQAATTQAISLAGKGVTGAIPQMTVSPSSLTFPAQGIGMASAPQVVTVSNTGSAPLNISSIRLEGVNAGDFRIAGTTCGVVQIGQTCSVSVIFSPSVSGTRTAALLFVDDLANSPQLTLSGTGGTPQLAFSTSAVTFSNQAVGASASQVISISNTGTAPLNITAMALTGADTADFRLLSSGCGNTLASGQSCTVVVSFTPTTLGLRSATISVWSKEIATARILALSGKGSTAVSPLVWRPSNGVWYLRPSVNGTQWGYSGDIPALADFDGDGKLDIAVWRPSTGVWWIVPSRTGAAYNRQWGYPGDIPVPGDYDGDGKADIAVWRPSTGVWWIVPSRTGAGYTQQWGYQEDTPVPGDYDGDGKADIAVWRPSTGVWWILPSRTGAGYTQQWGYAKDIPVPGDYDGDGKTDIAVWRPSTGGWWIVPSRTGVGYTQQWGYQEDIPVPGDYDGDGKTDIAVWRPSTGVWWITTSATSGAYTVQWGLPGDKPIVPK